MKSNNKYLHEISSNFGSSAESMSTNNKYLREIAKNTGSVDITGHHSDNYYLKRIALNTKDMDIQELLQTIAELRGEVEDLEEQLANDIHLFSCCKDIVQTGESLGLFAYCKHDGEVEGNTVYFYVVEPSIDDIIMKFTGTSFSTGSYNQFTGENIVIGWGDGTTTDYTTGSDFNHTYSEDTEHTITISNVTGTDIGAFHNTNITEIFIPSGVVSLGQGTFNSCGSLEVVTLSEGLTTISMSCFTACDSLTEITVPKSVISIESGFCGGTPIENINLLWDTSESIIEYDSAIYGYILTNNYTFTIPTGTTSLYEAKGYPSDKLQER